MRFGILSDQREIILFGQFRQMTHSIAGEPTPLDTAS